MLAHWLFRLLFTWPQQYSDSFTLVLEGMWEEILTATRTTLLTKAYGGADGLLRLNEALLVYKCAATIHFVWLLRFCPGALLSKCGP